MRDRPHVLRVFMGSSHMSTWKGRAIVIYQNRLAFGSAPLVRLQKTRAQKTHPARRKSRTHYLWAVYEESRKWNCKE